ncbi:23S rRNA (adenine(2030)-N(6))-methyltransferase RlmJ [Magnetovibrio sp.]|uniref:23S rRNA (adenine(2030)-N(6))-methyltransferase RlmJ n=1 Tax=Magnetovibrio sp. TaxID=2024836 RepID=UPI002F9330B5
MLSYQHAYHAGCPADVHKHAALARLLVRLSAVDEPLTLIETHAGRGLYSLTSPEAKKTREAQQGIVRLLKDGKLPPSHPLAKVIAKTRRRHGPAAYPGSPLIADTLLRPQDSIHLMELHPQEHAALEHLLGDKKNISIQRRDGFEATYEMAPPTPKRGLVLIDPSFEIKSEYTLTAEFIIDLNAKWTDGIILLWYPMLKAGYYKDMVGALEDAMLPGFHRSEMHFAKPENVRGMFGSGLVAVNLPKAFQPAIDAFTWPYPF